MTRLSPPRKAGEPNPSCCCARYRGAMALATALWLATAALAMPPQYGNNSIGRPTAETVPGLGAGHGQEDIPFGTRELQARQIRHMREEHQKQVVADSARLLQLATALKAETDKGATATPTELKDVDEIAKLAKKLSEHIKSQ